MLLTIILSKEVDTVEQGQQFYALVKEKVEGIAGVNIQGNISVPAESVNPTAGGFSNVAMD